MAYSPVYSAPFILYTPETPNTEFLVPEGYTAVIRQISATQDVVGFQLQVIINNVVAGAPVFICNAVSDGLYNEVQRQGHWVAPSGYLISMGLSSIGSGVSVYVGGYLLTNVVP